MASDTELRDLAIFWLQGKTEEFWAALGVAATRRSPRVEAPALLGALLAITVLRLFLRHTTRGLWDFIEWSSLSLVYLALLVIAATLFGVLPH